MKRTPAIVPLGILAGLALALPGRGDDGANLTAADVLDVIQKTAASIDSTTMVIAVTNRQGDILGVFHKPDAPEFSQGNFGMQVNTSDLAVGLARTGGFFSNNQAPLSSRTVRFISGIHFPPGISFTGNADLYGIENTNRGCPIADDADFAEGKKIPPAKSLNGGPGLGIITGKADFRDSDPLAVNPGGVPLFKNGVLAGGLGVAGVPSNVAEYAAYTGGWTAGFLPSPPPNDKLPEPQVVIIGGISLPFVNQQDRPAGVGPGTSDGIFDLGPTDSPGPAPDGYLIEPRDGSGGLTQSDVQHMIEAGIAEANLTRAVIRLPSGARAKFVFAVADLDGTIIGLNRMPDSTIFSIDVAVAKSRNVIYFSGDKRHQDELPGVPINTAVTNRTISFGAQPFYPPGIDYSTPGPFFDLYLKDTLNPCTQGDQPANEGKQNGIVFFPGSLPLYKNGALVGGLGVSGDGVDQDDFATAAAGAGFEPPKPIRADRIIDRGVRLPYQKFPRNPTN